MPRIKVFLSNESLISKTYPITDFKSALHGWVLPIPNTLDELKAMIFEKSGCQICNIFSVDGACIDNVKLMRDDEIIWAQRDVSCADDDQRNDCSNSDWIKLNVGGCKFLTTRETLIAKDSNSMLAKMFGTRDGEISWRNRQDSDGAYLFDRCGEYFLPLLNYLRHGQLIIDPGISAAGVLEEAKFFGLQSAVDALQDIVDKERAALADNAPLSRPDMMRYLLGSSSGSRLRCQGINLEGADLSFLDLSGANLSHANLRNSNLTSANLRGCVLDRADCQGALLDRADLACVQMKCAILDEASMRQVNMEDAENAELANLEGSSLKGVDLDSSLMQGVNLRVASLKNAKLTNCNMRLAVLAGTDLENADLSGSDLQNANLRGANVKNCAFGELKNPIHMTQTLNTMRR